MEGYNKNQLYLIIIGIFATNLYLTFFTPSLIVNEIENESEIKSYALASYTFNETYCDEIDNPNLNEMCLKNTQFQNISSQALTSKNPDICNLLDENYFSQKCYDNYYLNQAFDLNESKYCINIKLEGLKDECLENFS